MLVGLSLSVPVLAADDETASVLAEVTCVGVGVEALSSSGVICNEPVPFTFGVVLACETAVVVSVVGRIEVVAVCHWSEADWPGFVHVVS